MTESGLIYFVMNVPIRRVFVWLLSAQIGLAAILVWSDLIGLPRSLGGERIVEPVTTDAVEPGDQVRRYDPSVLPRRPSGGPEDVRRDPVFLPDRVGSLDFRLIDSDRFGRVMILFGTIGQGDSDRFQRALDTSDPRPEVIALLSPGGNVAEALRIGLLVRSSGLDTLVVADAACNSACPLILFGGVKRKISRSAWIGMHQAYLEHGSILPTNSAVSDVQTLQGEVLRFTSEMGVDPMVHTHALLTLPDQAYFLIEEELIHYRVATEIID